MNRKWVAGLLAVVLALSFTGCQALLLGGSEPTSPSGSSAYPYQPESPAIDDAAALSAGPAVIQTASVRSSEEIRAVWISYLEMATMLTGKSEKQFTGNIGKAFDNVKEFGLNTVIVQVRPFGDALYDSDYFPWSYTITGTEGAHPGFDPLAVMVAEAKARGLRIEAWINPYRVRASGNTKALSEDNQAKIWLEAGSASVVSYNGTVSYNPASSNARKLIVNGVTEIVRKYDVDGIHIDDYFYPTTDAAFDSTSYKAYQQGGGTLSLADWRRSNVETLVKQIYSAVKKVDSSVLFGISPQSSVDNNYSQQYLDVEKIAGSSGYCDYICPQIYFGYDNAVQPYAKTLRQWGELVQGSPVQLYVGLAAYKVGVTDSWAGSGKDEWRTNTDLLGQMVADARQTGGYQGFVLYRYDSVFNPDASVQSSIQKERQNLRSIL